MAKKVVRLHVMSLSNKNQSKFMDKCHEAIRNKIDIIKFVETWNLYAKNIDEHVFYNVDN